MINQITIKRKDLLTNKASWAKEMKLMSLIELIYRDQSFPQDIDPHKRYKVQGR